MAIDDDEAKAQRRAIVADNFAQRFGAGWRGVVGSALGLHRANLRRMFQPPAGRSDAPSETLVALSEALLRLPDARLPPRWRQSQSSSDRHSSTGTTTTRPE